MPFLAAIGIRGFLAIGLGLALLGMTLSRDHWKDEAVEYETKFTDLTKEAGQLLKVIREETGNPALTWKDAPAQVIELALSRDEWRETARKQSQRVHDMGKESERLAAVAEEAQRRQRQAIAKLTGIQNKFRTGAGRNTIRIDFEEVNKDTRKVLDDLREEGY